MAWLNRIMLEAGGAAGVPHPVAGASGTPRTPCTSRPAAWAATAANQARWFSLASRGQQAWLPFGWELLMDIE
jgi:hypothetical protein